MSLVFGRPVVPSDGASWLSARVQSETRDSFGKIEFGGESDGVDQIRDLTTALDSVEFPFRELPPPTPGWMALAFREDPEPLFLLRGDECRFRKVPRWGQAVALLLFHRLLRLRRDAIFFHAASLAVGGQGVMLVGRKGAGKSTTALALVARGHGFLGDETAGYLPATGELLPMRRPVGIKPGPRARMVDQALSRRGRDPDREGTLRLDLEDLMPVPAPPAVTLSAILFLSGFGACPEIARIEPTREELAELQPIVGSLVNASPTRRVFEMTRMLSRARVFRLAPGGSPEATAEAVEQTLTGQAQVIPVDKEQ